MPDQNFDNFFNATVSVFILIANDGWTPIYFDHYRAVGGVLATAYFLGTVIIGQWILFNLFLAILLKEFDDHSMAQE